MQVVQCGHWYCGQCWTEVRVSTAQRDLRVSCFHCLQQFRRLQLQRELCSAPQPKSVNLLMTYNDVGALTRFEATVIGYDSWDALPTTHGVCFNQNLAFRAQNAKALPKCGDDLESSLSKSASSLRKRVEETGRPVSPGGDATEGQPTYDSQIDQLKQESREQVAHAYSDINNGEGAAAGEADGREMLADWHQSVGQQLPEGRGEQSTAESSYQRGEGN